jgi:hypothetical protein
MAICSLTYDQYTRDDIHVDGVTSIMIRQLCFISLMVLIYAVSFAQAADHIKAIHPRLFIEDVKDLSGWCDGPRGGKIGEKPLTIVQIERHYNEF